MRIVLLDGEDGKAGVPGAGRYGALEAKTVMTETRSLKSNRIVMFSSILDCIQA